MALLSGDPVDVGVLGEKLGATDGGVPQELAAELSVVGKAVELADEGFKEVRGIVDEVLTGEALDDSFDWLPASVISSSLDTFGSSFLKFEFLSDTLFFFFSVFLMAF